MSSWLFLPNFAQEKFLNEQIEERELEREEFRIELSRLKSELEMKKLVSLTIKVDYIIY